MSTHRSGAINLQVDLHVDPVAACEEIVTFVRREVKRLGRRGVIIGLSGGLDSSTCAYLCARALGRRRVLGLLMPERDSDWLNMAHAQMVARELRLATRQVDLSPILGQIGVYGLVSAEAAADRPAIEAAVRWLERLALGTSAFSRGIAYAYGEGRPRWERFLRRLLWPRTGRVQAFALAKPRLRMLLLYHYAELNDCLVVGTTDRSELTIGFYERYGDGAYDIGLLRHLYKTQIQVLARYVGVPGQIVDKPSSGDLAAGLPNEILIGLRYEQLDLILCGLERRLPDDEIARQANTSRKSVRAVRQAIQVAHAREALPAHL
jgi:NAD+ synthase